MRHSLSVKAGSNKVRDIYVYYSEQNRGALCPFFFIICPAPFLPASLSAPVGFSQLLSGSGQKVPGRVRKEEDFKSLFFCNLMLILIGGHPPLPERRVYLKLQPKPHSTQSTSLLILMLPVSRRPVLLTCSHFVLLYRLHVDTENVPIYINISELPDTPLSKIPVSVGVHHVRCSSPRTPQTRPPHPRISSA